MLKGISTYPLADFGQKQLYASDRHLREFLVSGIDKSPSNRNSLCAVE